MTIYKTDTAEVTGLDPKLIAFYANSLAYDFLTVKNMCEIQIAWDGKYCDEVVCHWKAMGHWTPELEEMSDDEFRLHVEEQIDNEELNWYKDQDGNWTIPGYEHSHDSKWPQPFKDLEINLNDLEVTEEVLRRLANDNTWKANGFVGCSNSMARAVYKDTADAIKRLFTHFE